MRGPSSREGGWSLWRKHPLTEVCSGGQRGVEPFGDTFSQKFTITYQEKCKVLVIVLSRESKRFVFFKCWDCCEFFCNYILTWNLTCEDLFSKVSYLILPVLRWQLNPRHVLGRALMILFCHRQGSTLT